MTLLVTSCVLSLVAAACLSGCAPYRFGSRTLFYPNVSTVHVPIFESSSLRPWVGERLTEAVVKEIENRSHYKVVGSTDAQTVLSGRIVRDQKSVLAENENDEARQIERSYLVQISWVDRRAAGPAQSFTFAVPPVLAAVVANSSYVPEAGQSNATAELVAIEKLAAEIVDRMEMPW